MSITLRLAWRNLWRHPRRTWLTIAAMVFSNSVLVFMISLQFGMYDLMIDNTLQAFTGHLQVQAPGYKDDAKIRQVVPDAERLAEALRVELDAAAVTARSAAFALISSADRTYGVQVYGVDPRHEKEVSSLPGLVKVGRYLTEQNAQEIVIGDVLARNLQVSIGDEVTLLGSGRDGSFAAAVARVVGLIDSGVSDIDRNVAEMPIGFFNETFFMRDAAHALVIVTPGLASVDVYQQQVRALLSPQADLVVHDWDALQPGLRQAIQADLGSAFFMYGVLVILVAFSVMNTQLMSVLERTHEFGVVLSLGLTPGRLGRLVLLETALMGLAGLLLGALVGGLITQWFGVHGFSYPGMEQMAATFNLPARFYPQPTLLTLFTGPVVVFIGALASALYPALRLHWLHPVQAMRAV